MLRKLYSGIKDAIRTLPKSLYIFNVTTDNIQLHFELTVDTIKPFETVLQLLLRISEGTAATRNNLIGTVVKQTYEKACICLHNCVYSQ